MSLVADKLTDAGMEGQMNGIGIVVFNIPLDTLSVISETILQVRWPNQQRHSTEWQWLVNQVKDQSHQVQLTKR